MKLSIITVNLNNREGLLKTLSSVARQTFSDYEYLVIDGASNDGSVDVLNQFNDKISYWVSEQDRGIYNAMNKGIIKATGEYCLFLNSGDWLLNETVLANAFNLDFSEDIVYGIQLIEENNTIVETKSLDPEYLTFKSFIETSIPHQCTFIRRDLFGKIGLYNEKNRIVSDWEFNLIAIFKHDSTIRKIEIPISVCNNHGISNKREFMFHHSTEREQSLQRNFPRIFPDYELFKRLENRTYFKVYISLREMKNKLVKLLTGS